MLINGCSSTQDISVSDISGHSKEEFNNEVLTRSVLWFEFPSVLTS